MTPCFGLNKSCPPGTFLAGFRLMKIRPTVKWTCRNSGGIFFGVRYHFPISVVEFDSDFRATVRQLSIGFGPFTVQFDLLTDFKKFFEKSF